MNDIDTFYQIVAERLMSGVLSIARTKEALIKAHNFGIMLSAERATIRLDKDNANSLQQAPQEGP